MNNKVDKIFYCIIMFYNIFQIILFVFLYCFNIIMDFSIMKKLFIFINYFFKKKQYLKKMIKNVFYKK